MPNSIFNQPQFYDEAAAFAKLESIVWPNGPVCPHCGGVGRTYPLNGVKDKKGRVRLGLKKCGQCRGQFTVRRKTVFEVQSRPAAHLVSGHLLDVLQQERRQQQPATPYARSYAEDRVVHEPSATRGYARAKDGPDWRCR